MPFLPTKTLTPRKFGWFVIRTIALLVEANEKCLALWGNDEACEKAADFKNLPLLHPLISLKANLVRQPEIVRGTAIVETCSILTTTPNAVTSVVHDRTPVILDPEGYDLWLDPGMRDVNVASELLKPYDARVMRCYPVATEA
jgi:SOS response associated peptidase (SRAP)